MTSAMIGDPDRHFFMTRGVARVLGINLTDAMADGQLSAEAYATMVTRCRGCALVEACEDWLARTPSAATPPPGCCITARLQALRS